MNTKRHGTRQEISNWIETNDVGDPEGRTDYHSPDGIASWWHKDGAWHIALPAPDPDPKTGLKTGGFCWTEDRYPTKLDAIEAISHMAHEMV